MSILVSANADVHQLAAGDAVGSSLPGMVLLMAGMLVLTFAKSFGSAVRILVVSVAVLFGLIAAASRFLVAFLLGAFLVFATWSGVDTGANQPGAPDQSVSTQL